jgi:hypothetical protein
MELTGKCKEDFEKWYNNPLVEHVGLRRLPQWFYTLTESMQYGVYVDFFDSVGIFCEDRRYTDINMAWVVKYPNFKGMQDRFDGLTKTRQEARSKAIEKANEIYNAR